MAAWDMNSDTMIVKDMRQNKDVEFKYYPFPVEYTVSRETGEIIHRKTAPMREDEIRRIMSTIIGADICDMKVFGTEADP